MQPNEPTSIQQALAVLGLVVVTLLQGKKILKQASKLFPKGTGAYLIKQLREAHAYFVREATPPVQYPLLGRMAEALLSAHFYVQALNCLVLFVLVLLKLVMSDAAVWRMLVAACFAFLIIRMFWFCFTQAEKLRVKLREESVVLW